MPHFSLDGNMIKQTSLTLGIGAVGGFLASLAGFPAPYLTGSAILVTVACLSGFVLDIPHLLRNICFTIIGLSMGSGVTPEVIDTISLWPLASVILVVSLLATFFGSRSMLNRLWGFDMRSATLASSPGHLSFILGLSSQKNVDLPSISIIQSIRVMALTVVVPFAVMMLGLGHIGGSAPRPIMPLFSLLALAPAATMIGLGLLRIRFPAAFLLGGMVASTSVHVSGIVEGQMPPWLTMIAFAVMGAIIGSRFSNVTLKQLRRAAGAGLAAMALASLMAVAGGALAAWLLDMPLAQLLIAFAPGGLEAMAAMAVIMDVDTTFVAAQHVFRLLMLTFLAPAVLMWEDKVHPETGDFEK